jgi:hypothetical protein
MAQLAGEWIGEDVIHPTPFDPKGGTAKSRFTARMALGGFHLLMDLQQERDGKLAFEGHGVLGWDARGKCYTLHWFDCLGVEHGAPFFGTWDGDTLALVHETNHMGWSRQRYRSTPAGLELTLEISRDGSQWITFMESSYRRVSP